MLIFTFTILFFGGAMLIMAIGVIFSGRCLRGSCGGQAVFDADGDMLNCDTCPVRDEMPQHEETHETH